jgi:nicotinamidase/pyrazinamidase
MAQELRKGDALLIVDVQNDFVPGGTLAVPQGDEVIPVLNDWIEAARKANIPIYASRDWHPFNHISFQEQGGPWPPHCVQDTRGAQFHPDLKLAEDVIILSKADHPDKDAYSAFQGTELGKRLKAQSVKRLWVGGLALDYCVGASVLDALGEGIETHLILPGTRAIAEETARKTITNLKQAGAVLEEESEPQAKG